MCQGFDVCSRTSSCASLSLDELGLFFFFWLCLFLVVARGIFCLHCDMWDVFTFLVAAFKLLFVACTISFLNQGSNPGPLHLEHGVLAAGAPGRSLNRGFEMSLTHQRLSECSPPDLFEVQPCDAIPGPTPSHVYGTYTCRPRIDRAALRKATCESSLSLCCSPY